MESSASIVIKVFIPKQLAKGDAVLSKMFEKRQGHVKHKKAASANGIIIVTAISIIVQMA